MKKKVFAVHGTVIGGKFLGEYEAETKEQAIALAEAEHGGPISLCHQCSSECEDGFIDKIDADEIGEA